LGDHFGTTAPLCATCTYAPVACFLSALHDSKFESFAEAFRKAAPGNIAVVKHQVDSEGRRRYFRSYFVFGAVIAMAMTALLRSIIYADATWTKIKFWLSSLQAAKLTVCHEVLAGMP
jgi:hypothetical protein